VSVTIYHNPRCSKSRQTLELLRERGVEPTVVEYLTAPPTARELDRILRLLGREPGELLRKKEAAEAGLDAAALDRKALIQAMVDNPSVIERPIVVAGDKAAVGRPPESVLDIL